MTKIQIDYVNALENRRHNIAGEQAKLSELELSRDVLGETQRSNIAREQETNRSNVAKEAETHRSNVAKEEETKRSNLARETETQRTNLANESLRQAELAERNRSNLANEAIGRSQVGVAAQQVQLGYANLAETTRANQAREAETKRHNRVSEVIGGFDTGADVAKVASSELRQWINMNPFD